MESSYDSSDKYRSRHMQQAHNSESRPQIYKANNYDCANQLLNFPGLAAIKPVRRLISDGVTHCNYLIIGKSAGYKDEVPSELMKMTKRTAAQMKDQAFSGKNRYWL